MHGRPWARYGRSSRARTQPPAPSARSSSCSTRSAKASVAFVAIKEKSRFEGRQDLQTRVMTTLFALFAQVERELISERTREGLARARASGKKLGRPKGPLGTSRLDGREEENRKLLGLGVSKSAVVTGVSRPSLYVQLPQHPRHSGIRSAGMSNWRPYTWTLDGAPRCCLSDRIRKCHIWWGNVRKTRRNAGKTTRNPPGTCVTIRKIMNFGGYFPVLVNLTVLDVEQVACGYARPRRVPRYPHRRHCTFSTVPLGPKPIWTSMTSNSCRPSAHKARASHSRARFMSGARRT